MQTKFFGAAVLIVGGIIGVVGMTTVAQADHSWGGYHWSRSTNPVALTLADNVTASWDGYLATASNDWSMSTVLDTSVIAGNKDPRKCRPVAGRIDICNASYGKNGWLGIAQVWVSGDHITQGTVKLNDTYFKTSTYNTPGWKNLVMCQEVGHVFGLDHQDEIFDNANLGSCMDYTNYPVQNDGNGTNEHPNLHDYEELEAIYAHLDGTSTTGGTGTGANGNNVDMEHSREWGEKIRGSKDGRQSLHVRNFGNNQQVFTFAVWAE